MLNISQHFDQTIKLRSFVKEFLLTLATQQI
jgi:hypothetical protein